MIICGTPIIVSVPGGLQAGVWVCPQGCIHGRGFIEISFNTRAGFLPNQSGGVYDARGPVVRKSLKDVIEFSLGDELDDKNGLSITDRSPIPVDLQKWQALVAGSSNGGVCLVTLATIRWRLKKLCRLINWESLLDKVCLLPM